MLDNKQLGAIHIAKKEAELTDQEYRNLLQQVAGVDSAKYLSDEGYQAVMRAIRDRQYARPAGRSKCPQFPAVRKIWALWLGNNQGPGLRQFLPEREHSLAYLLGFARRAAEVPSLDNLSDLTGSQAYRVIEALKLRLAQEIARANTKVQQDIPF